MSVAGVLGYQVPRALLVRTERTFDCDCLEEHEVDYPEAILSRCAYCPFCGESTSEGASRPLPGYDADAGTYHGYRVVWLGNNDNDEAATAYVGVAVSGDDHNEYSDRVRLEADPNRVVEVRQQLAALFGEGGLVAAVGGPAADAFGFWAVEV
jgi:hypothetical protein